MRRKTLRRIMFGAFIIWMLSAWIEADPIQSAASKIIGYICLGVGVAIEAMDAKS